MKCINNVNVVTTGHFSLMFNIPQNVAYGLRGYILYYVVIFVHEMNFFTDVCGTKCLWCQEVF